MNTLRKTVLSILLSFMCLFTSVGYAAMSGSLTIHGSAEAEPPVAVFITSVADGGSLAGGSATVNNYSGTVANLSVTLGNDSSSSKTLRVTIFNNTLDYYTFKGVKYNVGEYTYDNTNIVFDTTVVQIGESNKLASDEYAVIDVTFRYDDYNGYSEDLLAVLDFYFGLSGKDEGTDYDSYVSAFLTNDRGYGLNDSHKGHVVLDHLLNYKLLYADDNITKGNLKQLLSAVNSNQTSNLTFVYQYISDKEVCLYTYEQKYNSSSNNGTEVQVYKTIFKRDAANASSEWSPSPSIGGTAPIAYVSTPAGTSLYAIDITKWTRSM